MYISQEEIDETRLIMGEDASNMSDKEIEELLQQIKKMIPLVIEFIEKQLEEKWKE